jgi:hypothetical protein
MEDFMRLATLSCLSPHFTTMEYPELPWLPSVTTKPSRMTFDTSWRTATKRRAEPMI